MVVVRVPGDALEGVDAAESDVELGTAKLIDRSSEKAIRPSRAGSDQADAQVEPTALRQWFNHIGAPAGTPARRSHGPTGVAW